jgi:hypothetical protein
MGPEVFTVMKIQTAAFCAVTTCNVVGGYEPFVGRFCLYLINAELRKKILPAVW